MPFGTLCLRLLVSYPLGRLRSSLVHSNLGVSNPAKNDMVHHTRTASPVLSESRVPCRPTKLVYAEPPPCRTCRYPGSRILGLPPSCL
jgi:hypothetical protein